MDNRRERELVLAPNEYAYILDTTKGHINCYVGPNKTSLAQTDQPVVFDCASKRFRHLDLQDAVSLFATAPANWYIALKNPARDGVRPNPGVASTAPELQVGRKHNVPGPVSFALWPGQMARVIEGHRLRADEYLLVRVYDAEAARAAGPAALGRPADDEATPPARLAVGELHIIKGTDTRFYIPPTGVEVVSDDNNRLVRRAVRLQRLEYCVLIGEDGRRRIVRGEAVVFPAPDERFELHDGRARFPAIELCETTGLHVKVTAPYTEADGTKRREGEELFITGSQVLYFPRDEHVIIRQGQSELHQAVALPRGEGRYVLDRLTGEVSLKPGPLMFLPDPRREVIVRRLLSDRECALLYPGNDEALLFNRALRRANKVGESPAAAVAEVQMPEAAPPPRKRRGGPDELERPAFVGPRTLTLDTRFEGAVRVEVWSGFAVQVVDKRGARRVVQGPSALLLGYDEMLQPLTLSTGTPKTDARRLSTAYLQIAGNKVSDRVSVVTADLVEADVTVTYRVDFEGDPDRWFAVEDYVKLLCDHAGSLIKARARQLSVRALQGGITPIVRDLLLGARPEDGGPRPGRAFTENGMRVYDVEVLAFGVTDDQVAELLEEAQHGAVQSAIEVAGREADLAHRQRLEEIERALARARHETETLRRALTAEQAAQAHAEAEASQRRQATLAGLVAAAQVEAQAAELARAARAREAAAQAHAQTMAQRQAEQALELEALAARVDGAVRAAQVISPQLAAALERLGDQQLLGALSQHFGELAVVEGRGLLETARKFLDFAPATLTPALRPPTASPG